MSAVFRVLILLTAALVLSACGRAFPADPDHTLDRVRGGTLRVGVSIHPPWTTLTADGRPSGYEIDLVEALAERLEANVDWSLGGEEPLITRLEDGELDLVVGGLSPRTPWTDKAAVTRPYAGVSEPGAEPVELVMAAPMGENAFLRVVESFLHERAPLP